LAKLLEIVVLSSVFDRSSQQDEIQLYRAKSARVSAAPQPMRTVSGLNARIGNGSSNAASSNDSNVHFVGYRLQGPENQMTVASIAEQ
jgi:hypothetical protein